MNIDEQAVALADAIDLALPRWVVAVVDGMHRAWSGSTPSVVLDAAARAGQKAGDDVGVRVRALLETDVDEQWTTPLALLRQAVAYPTAVLREAGVPPVVRDAYAEAAFPDDRYGLSPSTWTDIAPELGDPGIAWGAAKAWAHRQRHVASPAHDPGPALPAAGEESR
jgi:uncharacterized protein (DUF1800 family)